MPVSKIRPFAPALRFLALLALLTVPISGRALASPPPAPHAKTVERIRKLYADVNEAIRADRARQSVFYTDGEGYAARQWKRVTTKEEREAANRSHFVATVHFLEGAVAKVTFRIGSPSGDWENTTEYYFYPDGRAAFRFESHFTHLGPDADVNGHPASGPYLIEKRRYFDPQAHVVYDLDRAIVVSTGRQVALSEVQHADVDTYASVSELPFCRQLRRAANRRATSKRRRDLPRRQTKHRCFVRRRGSAGRVATLVPGGFEVATEPRS